MAGALQSRSGHHCMLRSQGTERSLHQIIDHYVTYTGPATSRADKSQSVHNQNPLIVNVWFYQFLLHKHIIDPFKYARIIKPKKGWFYLVLIHHMQIPAVHCRLTTKHTLLPTAHQKASHWWKWLIHKIFVAEAKAPNGGFRLLMTKILHSLTSEYGKGLSIYRKPP